MDRQNLKKKIAGSLPPDTLKLLETVGDLSDRLDCRAALIGGPVRDFLLGQEISEIDCVVEGDAHRLGKSLAKRLKAKLTSHPRFLTCRVELPGGGHIDLATARTETYSRPGALPAVSPSTIEDDLKRRDFSINALAIRLDPSGFGALLDPLGGAADLEGHTLRVLHDRSFIDDPTRALRGIRFAARLGLRWERRTKKLLLEALGGDCLRTVSGSRLKKEWSLLLSEESRAVSARALQKFDIANRLVDGLRFSTRLILPRDNIRPALDSIEAPGLEPWRIYTMALLEEAKEKPARAFMKRLSFTKREQRIVSQGTFLSPPVRRAARDKSTRLGDLYLQIADIEKEAAIFILASETSRNAHERLQKCLSATPRLHISGGDLRALGYAPSPAFKAVFDELLKLKAEGKVSTKREELAAANKILGKPS